MKKNLILIVLLVSGFLMGCVDQEEQAESIAVVPYPQTVKLSSQKINLLQEIKCVTYSTEDAWLADFIVGQLNRIYGAVSEEGDGLELLFVKDESLAEEAYVIEVEEESIVLKAAGNLGYVRAASTLLQMPDDNGELPMGVVKDEPDHEYRALMIDCSRSWYSMATLKQIIDLCFWYKIKYVHMHLTDDALFTFPSTSLPELASEQSYALVELGELNEYAIKRGCVLIPEIDMPGHSSVFIEKYSETFALSDTKENYWTMNMGKRKVYEALEKLIEEVAAAFPYSPYIHVGGDEVNFRGMKGDPDIDQYMKENNIENFKDLYHHFIVEVTQMVKDQGKTPMIWSDFTNSGPIKVPNDVVVMVWKTGAYHPDDLVHDGFKIVNASWQPLYVVNNRKWKPSEIYEWNPKIWRSSQTPYGQAGLSMKGDKNLLGSSMSVWEQNEYKFLISLKERLPAMSEKLWNVEKDDFNDFSARMDETNEKLHRNFYGFELIEEGLSYPDWEDSNYDEHMWYEENLRVSTKPKNGLNVGYHYFTEENVKRRLPAVDDLKLLSGEMKIEGDEPMIFQAYRENENGKREAVGYPVFKKYSLRPIAVNTEGLVADYKPHNWVHHRFTDSLKVSMSAKLDGDIYYTLDNSVPGQNDLKYEAPFYVHDNMHLRAKLFSKESEEEIGKGFHQEYVKIGVEKSLTTNKPVTTSNGANELGNVRYVTDGMMARWEHLGANAEGEKWVMIDLGQEEQISKFKTYFFWDGERYYQYSIEVSIDAENWKMVVDKGSNKEISKPEGMIDVIVPTVARYLKLNLIRNSANPSVHLVEFNAFK